MKTLLFMIATLVACGAQTSVEHGLMCRDYAQEWSDNKNLTQKQQMLLAIEHEWKRKMLGYQP